MKIKSVGAKSILDSRKDKTIYVSINTNIGKFGASSPSGKSTGKHEVKPYKKNLEDDIKTIKKFSDYFSEENIESFDDLRRIEDIMDGHVGGNTILALEYASLKALAKEKKKQVWELIDSSAKKFPRLVGNCVGGGTHTTTKNRKPDFQEFLLIPKTKTVEEAYKLNKKIQEDMEFRLKEKDVKFESKKNDENAWVTTLNEKEVLDLLKEFNINLGLDIAASSFYKRKKYHYENPMLRRTQEEQIFYVANLIKNYPLVYVEDPLGEEEFGGFGELIKKSKDVMIVGDDLIVTSSKRLKKALEEKSVNAIIVKPNQCGSLLEVRDVVKLCKAHDIKMIFSHRSGETEENILADVAFGFGADFFKCGIGGKERESKIKRLIDIEKKLKK